jgi:hypothetical protein
MNKEIEFPEIHWPAMQSAMENEGVEATIAVIEKIELPQRLNLFAFAQQAFGQRAWKNKSLAKQTELVKAGICAAMEFSKSISLDGDAERAANIKDFANVMSFNLSADLAECWPGDDVVRQETDLKAGLAAAEDCVRWRHELEKGPTPFSMAHWVLGMHQISLAQYEEAVKNFSQAVEYGQKAATANNRSSEITASGDFSPIVSYGYLGIAETLAGQSSGKEKLTKALAVFKEQAEQEPALADDANFGISQLEYVSKKFLNNK